MLVTIQKYSIWNRIVSAFDPGAIAVQVALWFTHLISFVEIMNVVRIRLLSHMFYFKLKIKESTQWLHMCKGINWLKQYDKIAN